MKGPFRIVRKDKDADGRYCFELWRFVDDDPVTLVNTMYSRGIIAPEYLRRMQATLNTRALLDYGR